MRSLKFVAVTAAALAIAGCASQQMSQPVARPDVKFGKPIAASDLATWDIDIRTSDGKGLPPGSGSVALRWAWA